MSFGLSEKNKLVAKFAAAILIPTISLMVFLKSPFWTDPEGAKETLEQTDWTISEVGQGRWFGGRSWDIYRTNFRGETCNGKPVSGFVTGKGAIYLDPITPSK